MEISVLAFHRAKDARGQTPMRHFGSVGWGPPPSHAGIMASWISQFSRASVPTFPLPTYILSIPKVQTAFPDANARKGSKVKRKKRGGMRAKGREPRRRHTEKDKEWSANRRRRCGHGSASQHSKLGRWRWQRTAENRLRIKILMTALYKTSRGSTFCPCSTD